MNLCEMWDAPIPLSWAVGYFAVFVVLGGAGGVLAGLKGKIFRLIGGLLLAIVLLADVKTTLSIRNQWGITLDRTTCRPINENAVLAILIGLNLAVVGAAILGTRWRRLAGSWGGPRRPQSC
jgi:hypothetical protein